MSICHGGRSIAKFQNVQQGLSWTVHWTLQLTLCSSSFHLSAQLLFPNQWSLIHSWTWLFPMENHSAHNKHRLYIRCSLYLQFNSQVGNLLWTTKVNFVVIFGAICLLKRRSGSNRSGSMVQFFVCIQWKNGVSIGYIDAFHARDWTRMKLFLLRRAGWFWHLAGREMHPTSWKC